jgi:hypothetical protein
VAPNWTFADLGFDTGKKLWFISYHDSSGGGQGILYAAKIVLKDITASQYQWPDPRGNLWHVRERILASRVKGISQDEQGTITVYGITGGEGEEPSLEIPEFDYLEFAWHLKTSLGFVNFFKEGRGVGGFDDRVLSVESLTHQTVGEYPMIRLRAEAAEIQSVIATSHSVIIRGKSPGATSV